MLNGDWASLRSGVFLRNSVAPVFRLAVFQPENAGGRIWWISLGVFCLGDIAFEAAEVRCFVLVSFRSAKKAFYNLVICVLFTLFYGLGKFRVCFLPLVDCVFVYTEKFSYVLVDCAQQTELPCLLRVFRFVFAGPSGLTLWHKTTVSAYKRLPTNDLLDERRHNTLRGSAVADNSEFSVKCSSNAAAQRFYV